LAATGASPRKRVVRNEWNGVVADLVRAQLAHFASRREATPAGEEMSRVRLFD
jgi:hypothetical protein